jgi:FAD-dependent urate hydroxylase
MNRAAHTETVIVGAGPFGLSIAAHLQAAGADFRIFGRPMNRWLSQMPLGMFLKSEGRASSLSDPLGEHTIGRYCAAHGLPYDDRALPVSIETFTAYALAFQRELVPCVEELYVTRIEASGDGFDLTLENGAGLRARKVIIATGLEHTAYMPPCLGNLPSELRSHSGDHRNLARFRDRDVTVIGGGQSALETAALLREAGAHVHVVVRKPAVRWNSPPRLGRRSLYQRLRCPLSNLGEGPQLWAYSNLPQLFRHLPRHTRISKVRTVLGAAGAWWLRPRVEAKVELLTGVLVSGAAARGGRVALTLSGENPGSTALTTDHVIAGTGYRYDLGRLPFLSVALKEQLGTEDHRPILSMDFESTVPGLYFTGIASAYHFGPSMRFIDGVTHTAHAVSRHILAHRKHFAPTATRAASASN